ncbi:TMEM165/GDT1 family protein [Gordonia soli]|uniref:GDT1 family protein n=1 Tax=Gordonia soli NBRC 108243 TaxID=1223545 RepID=M0QPD7_9ACTN|nr:TMEM165/GDT1 family protein [Gordonia soli]GAC69302.1 hypothetical protein GS4_23_00990 [Gordonia soli NBRC 108243]
MLAALLVSFGVIFVAELGDKSQLMAMTYALRYRWWIVLLAITVATTAVHAVSVFFGHFLGLSLPTALMSVLAGIAMLVFGLWTLRGDSLTESESSKATRVGASVFFAVMSAFFLAELGDKTMLATITLSTNHNWLGVWIGSTVGMVAADALAIAVGALLGKHLPERSIAIGASILFFGFAAWLMYEGLADATAVPIVATISAVVVIVGLGVWLIRRNRRSESGAQAVEADETTDDSSRPIAR